KLGVHFQPSVCVPIAFVTDSIRLPDPLSRSRIYDRPGHGDTRLFHHQPIRMVDVIPYIGITRTCRWRRAVGWCAPICWSPVGYGRYGDVLREDPANLIVLGPDVIETAVGTCIHQRDPDSLGQMPQNWTGCRRVAAKNDVAA